jgi:hypothetical protein
LRGTATADPKRKLAEGRKCYVRIDQGPLIVWKAYKRGYYKPESARALGRGRMVRLGTYGDPAAIPAAVWDDLLAEATGWTGYSHQSGFRPDLVMQSADTFEAAADFWSQGMRTFRVVQSLADVIPTKEVLCPASAEAGRRTTCEACKLHTIGHMHRPENHKTMVFHGRSARRSENNQRPRVCRISKIIFAWYPLTRPI